MATQEHLINYVQAQFPTAAREHIRSYLNVAAEEISEATLVMRDVVTVTLDGTSTSYALESNILRVDRAVWSDSELCKLILPPERMVGDGTQAAYRISGGRLYVGKMGENVLVPITGSVDLYCRVKADDLSQFLRLYDSDGNAIVDSDGNDVYVVGDELQEGSGLPSFIHIGLSHFALRELHLAAGNLGQADRYDTFFKRAITRARRYANQNQNTFPSLLTSRF